MSNSPKFKVGDRVVIVQNFSNLQNPTKGEAGTVVDVNFGLNEFLRWSRADYQIHWDNLGLEDTHETFEGEIEFESVYNSPLYKALQEK